MSDNLETECGALVAAPFDTRSPNRVLWIPRRLLRLPRLPISFSSVLPFSSLLPACAVRVGLPGLRADVLALLFSAIWPALEPNAPPPCAAGSELTAHEPAPDSNFGAMKPRANERTVAAISANKVNASVCLACLSLSLSLSLTLMSAAAVFVSSALLFPLAGLLVAVRSVRLRVAGGGTACVV